MRRILFISILSLSILLSFVDKSFGQYYENLNIQDITVADSSNTWKSYSVENLYISINVAKIRQYGNYYLVALYIQNLESPQLLLLHRLPLQML